MDSSIVIIWCDRSFENGKSYQSMKDEFNKTTTVTVGKTPDAVYKEIAYEEKEDLRSLNVPLITVQTADDVLHEIKERSDKKLFVISSGTIGRYLVPEILRQYPYIHNIYIYTHNISLHTDWTEKYGKRLKMFNFHTNLLIGITRDISDHHIEMGNFFMRIDSPRDALECFKLARNLEVAANKREISRSCPSQSNFDDRLDLFDGDTGLIFRAQKAIEDSDNNIADTNENSTSSTPNHTLSEAYLHINQQLLIRSENKPVGVKLTQIRIYQYNQLKWDDVTKNGIVFDLAGPLTTLVGPNKSGKTTLIKVIQMFCNAVKNGTGEYSQQEALELFGVDYSTSVDEHIVQGTFSIHYNEDRIQPEELTLSVTITKKTSNNVHVHVFLGQVMIVLQNINKLHEDKDQGWVSFARHLPPAIERNQYGLFTELFPTVKVFNSRKVFDNTMKNLLLNDPVVPTKASEISTEMQHLFPESSFDWNSIEPDKEFLKRYCTSLNREEYEAHIGGHLRDKINMPLKIMSEGEHQCFQLLIHLCCAPQHSLVLIDEPDAHLFSNAQKTLVHIIHRKLHEYDAQQHFCQMVITTHSTDIMQQVQLHEIRQIFPTMKSKYAFEVKSLACTAQLLNIMESMGLSVLDHGEIVRLAVHRRLLLLENRNDQEFLYGIIRRAEPNLLQIPLTVLEKGGPHNHAGGRFQPADVKEFIKIFNQLLPNNSVLKIFILLDADLRARSEPESPLRKEEDAYKKLENGYGNVKIYYHCWDAREWENWLLFNEDLLCDMLTGTGTGQLQSIQELRNKMMRKYEQQTNPDLQKPPTDRETFRTWFINEINRHACHLYLHKLTPSELNVSISKNDSVHGQQQIGREYLHQKNIDSKIFGDDEKYVLSVLGSFVKSQQRDRQQESPKKKLKSGDDKSWYTNVWLKDRKLPTLNELYPNASNDETRKQLIKWIDAKDFFHELTEDSNYKCVGQVWKQAFSSDTSGENGFFGRYFESLDPSDDQKWPEDFTKLLKLFTEFSQTS